MRPKRPKALPSKVYVYGCSAPMENEEAVYEQLFLANRYRNQLVEIELDRRKATQAIISETEVRLARISAQIDTITSEIERLKAEKKSRNATARKRQRHPDLDLQINRLIAERKPMSAQFKEVKKATYKSPENKAALDASTEAAKAAKRAARKIASRECGLHWGTYLLVESAAADIGRGAPPKFRRFRREDGGSIGVQIQTKPNERLGVDEFLAGKSNQVQIKDGMLRLCIGAETPTKSISKTNPPRYVAVRVKMHRPLPEGAHVTWVKLIARRVGTKLKWETHITVANARGFAKPVGTGTVSLDVGYRDMGGEIRVASWLGSDGRFGELVLPQRLVSALAHKDELKSLRDTKFDIIRATLVGYRKVVELPEWLREETKTLAQWKSISRLHRLVRMWRENRFDGDAGMFALAEAWRIEDAHHLNWLDNEAEQARRWRDDLYRKFAAELRRHYGTVALEDLDLRQHAEADHLALKTQRQRAMAAISHLRRYLSDMKVVKVPAANTTKRCHRCLHLNHVGSDVTYHCMACGWTGDRDYNAAVNILREATCLEKAGNCSHEAA